MDHAEQGQKFQTRCALACDWHVGLRHLRSGQVCCKESPPSVQPRITLCSGVVAPTNPKQSPRILDAVDVIDLEATFSASDYSEPYDACVKAPCDQITKMFDNEGFFVTLLAHGNAACSLQSRQAWYVHG